jgi:hypothetical protein
MLDPNRAYRKESAAALSRHFLSRAYLYLICLGLLGALAPVSYATAQWWDSQAETLRVANRLALLPDLRDTDAVGKILGTKFDATEIPPVAGVPFYPFPAQPLDIKKFSLKARDPAHLDHIGFGYFQGRHTPPANRFIPAAAIVLQNIAPRSCLKRSEIRTLISGKFVGLPATDGGQILDTYRFYHGSYVTELQPLFLNYNLAQTELACFQGIDLSQKDR